MTTTPEATRLNVSSSADESLSITDSQIGITTKSKPTKKVSVVEADPESVATKKAKTRKEKDSGIIKEVSNRAKRVSIVSPDEPSGKKPALFQKLWSDDDEITVLKAMVKYTEEKGVYPMSNRKGFYAVVKDNLVGGFDCEQLAGKVRKLKDKYMKSSKILTPHDKKVRKISKDIWGPNSYTSPRKANFVKKTAAISNGDVKATPTEELEKEQPDADNTDDNNDASKTEKERRFIGKKIIAMGMNADFVNERFERCSDAVKAEIEEEWEAFHLEEAVLFQKKLNLVLKELNVIL